MILGEEEFSEEMNELLNETYEGFNKKWITFSGKYVESRQGTVPLEGVLKKWIV